MPATTIKETIENIRHAEEIARKRYERTEMVEGYTIAELRAAFDMVADPENWKNPIDAWVRPEFFHVTRQAIMFFAGCTLNGGTVNADGRINIKAVGYYVAVGS